MIVMPETVVCWHRAGFRLYWNWLSRHRKVFGRKPIGKEIRNLIFRMAAENPTWGAPRIHGELLKLGFDVSERTVSRWVQRVPKSPKGVRRWKAFLQNHREADCKHLSTALGRMGLLSAGSKAADENCSIM